MGGIGTRVIYLDLPLAPHFRVKTQENRLKMSVDPISDVAYVNFDLKFV